ncbi:sulfite exporter TauE/SafE family protein [Endozoicomonadaceae bacterium StTr2]
MFILEGMQWWLVLAAFFTSLLTAVIGTGGGILLISLMPGLIPAVAIVPVHGAVQLSSNASRMIFGWRSVRKDMVLRYLAGAGLGTLLGSQLVLSLEAAYIPTLLGCLILVVTWLPPLPLDRLPGRFTSFGIVHALLATLTGATGPLSSAFLSRQGLDRDPLITTVAAYMTVTHGLKVIAFGVLGLDLTTYIPLIIAMSLSVIVASWIGTRLRRYVPEVSFQMLFKVIITLLAIRLIVLL